MVVKLEGEPDPVDVEVSAADGTVVISLSEISPAVIGIPLVADGTEVVPLDEISPAVVPLGSSSAVVGVSLPGSTVLLDFEPP